MVRIMASINLRKCVWHVTQARLNGLNVWEPAPVLGISNITGNGKTNGRDAFRAIGFLLKSAEIATVSAKAAIGRTNGKPLAAIEA